MTLRARLIQILLTAGGVFFVGAWSVASLNAQMRENYQTNYEAQKQLIHLSKLREEVNKHLALMHAPPKALVKAIAEAPTAYDCCVSQKEAVVDRLSLYGTDEDIRKRGYLLTGAWAQLFELQIERLEREQASWQSFVNLRNWLVPTLATILLALSLGIAWFRVRTLILDPVEEITQKLVLLLQGRDASDITISGAPKELIALDESFVELIQSHRDLLRGRGEQSAETSKQSEALELQLQKLVEIASKPAFVLDTSGAVRTWNQHMMELTGFSRARANKVKFVDEFLTEESRVIFEEAFLMARREVTPDEFRCEIRVGSRIIDNIQIRLSPQVDSALGVNRILAVVNTENALDAAAVIISSNSDAKARTGKTERLVSEIANSLDLIASEGEGLDEIESLRQLNSLKSAISWIGGRSYERSNERLDIVELVEHFAASIMMRLEWRGIELKLNTIVDKAFVTGNAASLLQVLQAIIENAEEAMDVAASHPKKLMIKIWHEESDVLIRIIDSGSGLQIGGGLSPLSPFVTTKSREGHAGLGLTQARDLIDEMNGSLTINAEKAGFGLGVLLRLPLLEGDGA